MRKVKEFATRFNTGVMLRMAGVRTESGDHLLEVLGTIIIAVVILIFFRQQIVELFNEAITQASTSVKNLFTNVVTP